MKDSAEITIFYTEMLKRKVDLWSLVSLRLGIQMRNSKLNSNFEFRNWIPNLGMYPNQHFELQFHYYRT